MANVRMMGSSSSPPPPPPRPRLSSQAAYIRRCTAKLERSKKGNTEICFTHRGGAGSFGVCRDRAACSAAALLVNKPNTEAFAFVSVDDAAAATPLAPAGPSRGTTIPKVQALWYGCPSAPTPFIAKSWPGMSSWGEAAMCSVTNSSLLPPACIPVSNPGAQLAVKDSYNAWAIPTSHQVPSRIDARMCCCADSRASPTTKGLRCWRYCVTLRKVRDMAWRPLVGCMDRSPVSVLNTGTPRIKARWKGAAARA